MRVPKHISLLFEPSTNEPGKYVLSGTGTGRKFKRFTSLELETPFSVKLREMGAEYVLNGYKGGQKSLFTALFSLGNGFYYGDHYTPENVKKRKLIIVKISGEITVYYFNTYPKTHARKLLKHL